jgi:hypothetical protein
VATNLGWHEGCHLRMMRSCCVLGAQAPANQVNSSHQASKYFTP